MKLNYISFIQGQFLILLFFLLNFERWDPLNLGIDYLIFKIPFVLLLLSFSFSFSKLFKLNLRNPVIKYILIYFIILTFISFINSDKVNNNYFDSLFCINLILFLLTFNYLCLNRSVIYKCFIFYSFGAFILSILYLFNIGTESDPTGRVSIFGENQNSIGVNMCFASLMIISIVFENKLKLNKLRYLLLFQLPTIIIFLAATGSRLATISLLISIAAYFLLWNAKNVSKKIILLFTTFSLFFILFTLFGNNSIISERISDTVKSGEIGNRDLLLIMIIPIVLNNLFFGVGLTGYNKLMIDNYTSPHNGIVEVLCYTGIFGLIFFLTFFIKSLIRGINKKKIENEILPLVFYFPIIGILISAQIFQSKIVWILLAYVIAHNKKIEMK